MKKSILICFVCTAFLFSSCATTNLQVFSAKEPPGQVKKVTGAKSAKAYAPGQQKSGKQKQ